MVKGSHWIPLCLSFEVGPLPHLLPNVSLAAPDGKPLQAKENPAYSLQEQEKSQECSSPTMPLAKLQFPHLPPPMGKQVSLGFPPIMLYPQKARVEPGPTSTWPTHVGTWRKRSTALICFIFLDKSARGFYIETFSSKGSAEEKGFDSSPLPGLMLEIITWG